MVSTLKGKYLGMTCIDSLESFTLGALWAGVVFSVVGQFGKSGQIAVGASGAICGLVGNMIWKNWNDPRPAISLMFPFSLLVTIPNMALHLVGFHIPESLTVRQFFYIFVSLSIVLTGLQNRTGRGFISHSAHLGGLSGGIIGAYNKSLQS